MYTLLALQWYAAQHTQDRTAPVPFLNLPSADQQKVKDRVRDVLQGNVLHKDCTAGDLAIWEGRYRVLPAPPVDMAWDGFKTNVDERTTLERGRQIIDKGEYENPFGLPTRREPDGYEPDEEARPAPKMHGVKERRWQNFWDTVLVEELVNLRAIRLFGNANVGNLALTNLQVAGQLASDQTYSAQAWYVSGVMPDGLEHLIAEAFHSVMITMVVGERPQSQLPLLDLFLQPRPLMTHIPVHQNFAVHVEVFGFKMKELNRRLACMGESMPLRVHFEGWQTRDIA